MLFYRFINESLCAYLSEQEEDSLFDYSTPSDDQAEYGSGETIREKGFFTLPSELFFRVLSTVDKDGMSLEKGGEDLNDNRPPSRVLRFRRYDGRNEEHRVQAHRKRPVPANGCEG